MTGLADWLTITRRTSLWRTATTHMIVMVLATVLFAAAAIVGYAGYDDGEVGSGPLVLVLCAFVLLTAGGWLGGAIVFVHGMRVLGLPDEPASSAVSPGGEEKERAAAS